MAVIALLAKDDSVRRELQLAVEELGHRAAPAADLKGGLELLGSERPRVMLVAQDPADDVAESMLFELEREAPLTPVVVALTRRSAPRALELLKAGAHEVVSAPFSAQSLRGALSKAARWRGTWYEEPRPAAPAETARALGAWALAALLLFGAAAGGVAFYRHRQRVLAGAIPAPAREWDLPYGHASGLAFDGKEVWVSDWFSATVFRHEPGTMRVVGSATLPREVPGAMAFAGGGLLVASAPRTIVRHMLDEKLSVLSRSEDSAAQSVGMAYDGLYLWTCDAKKGRLHKRVLDGELTPAASFEYPGVRPAALAFDGRRLWSFDAGTKELLRHDLDDPRRVLLRLPLAEYSSGDWSPVGLAYDGRRFLSVATRRRDGVSESRLFAHELSAELAAALGRP